VWTRVHREFFRDEPGGFDFRKPGKVFVEEYAKFIEHKSRKLLSYGMLEETRKALAGVQTF
jgi:fructose-bisphosphate aldolase class II